MWWSRESVRVSERGWTRCIHPSGGRTSPIAYHTKQQQTESQQHGLRHNEICQKHQIPLASFGWIMLHFLHCRHPFFFHARAQPASKPRAVAALSFFPPPSRPGPKSSSVKIVPKSGAYSCPSLQTFPSPLLHRLALSFNRQPTHGDRPQDQLPARACLSLSPSLSRRHNNALETTSVYQPILPSSLHVVSP